MEKKYACSGLALTDIFTVYFLINLVIRLHRDVFRVALFPLFCRGHKSTNVLKQNVIFMCMAP